jgi:tRNA (mo5U34)-methyltransferase
MLDRNPHRMAPPPPPAGFNAEQTFAGVYWHQEWEVFRGVWTPGRNPVSHLCEYAQLPTDLSGKRVLDIGAWNGCFSFECERRGAREVIAYSLENPDVIGFNRLKAVLGSKVEYVQGSVYSLTPERLGLFDLILFFGVLYHLRYPLLGIDRIRTVSHGDVLIETHTTTNRHLVRPPLTMLSRLVNLSCLFRKTPIWRQYREYELHPEDQSNWFGPNIQAVLEAFESAGFEIRHLNSWGGGARSSFRATVAALPSRLVDGTYEGLSTLNAHLTGIRRGDGELFRRS